MEREETKLETILKAANEGDKSAYAFLLMSNGYYNDAISSFKEIIDEAMSKPNKKLTAAWAYDHIASCHLLQYQLVEAMHAYENALELRKIALPEGNCYTLKTIQNIDTIKTMMRFCEMLTIPMREFDGEL